MIPVLNLSDSAGRQRVEALLAHLRLDPKQLATRQDEASAASYAGSGGIWASCLPAHHDSVTAAATAAPAAARNSDPLDRTHDSRQGPPERTHGLRHVLLDRTRGCCQSLPDRVRDEAAAVPLLDQAVEIGADLFRKRNVSARRAHG